MPRIQHLIETRFSVWLRLSEAAFSSEWLQGRVELWRRFCLPSIAAQTATDFTWMVFCDESTDPQVLEALRSCESQLPALEVMMTAADRTPVDLVRARVHPDTDVLITTWLDSDDALAGSYVESVQAYAEPFAQSDFETLVVNFPRGYRLDVATGELYEDRMVNSPFPSLLERPGDGPVQTVLGTSHVMLSHGNPTQQDESLQAWLIAVHGGNLINDIDPRNLAAGFVDGGIPGFPESVASR